jgi:hypothetical protein
VRIFRQTPDAAVLKPPPGSDVFIQKPSGDLKIANHTKQRSDLQTELGVRRCTGRNSLARKRDFAFHSTYPAKRRDNAGPTSDWRGGSAPARPHVKAAQVDANDNARPSSSEFNRASVPRLIRPIARKANNRAA